MKKYIKNEEDGKYLLIESHKTEETFEDRMIKTINCENLLTPSVVYDHKKRHYCFCINGLRTVKDYLYNRELSKEELENFIFQLNSISDITGRFMLSEKNLIADPDAIFVREENRKLVFCIAGEESKLCFSNGIKRLMEEIITHIDEEDAYAVKLGLSVFKICRSPEFHIYDIMDAMRKSRIKKNAETINDADMDDIEETYAAKKQDNLKAAETDKEENSFEDQFIEELPEKNIIFKHIIKLIISIGIMLLALIVVFIIKGFGTVKKIVPFFAIIIACLGVYTFIQIMREKKNDFLPADPVV